MLNLSAKNIRLNAQAASKTDAIRAIAAGLAENGFVAAGYEAGMLARETQTSTFLGNGIAIPHGTLDTRHLVQQTGVQIFQFPQGVEWGEGNVAYVAIGIAAKSDEHLTLLRQLTSVLGDETAAAQLAKTADLAEFIAILNGQKTQAVISETLISLDIASESLLTLAAINAGKLQENGYANAAFVAESVANVPFELGEKVFVGDSAQGNLANGIAIARNTQGKTLVSVAAVDNQLQPLLARLLNRETRQQFASASAAELLALLGGEASVNAQTASEKTDECQAEAVLTVRNDNGLHARPSAVLVQTLKPFEATVSVANLDRQTAPANAKSTMRVVGLGATQGQRLRFVATGADALPALEALAAAFAAGLGESVSDAPVEGDFVAPISAPAQTEAGKNGQIFTRPDGSLEMTFVIPNAHGLHARPSGALVTEVKRYGATVMMQNVDRNSELVNAKSLMKVVSLGVTKGQRVRFVATGAEAERALNGIRCAIESGLGE